MTKIPKSMQGRQRAKKEVRGNELYETHPAATLALMRAEELPFRIWEPNCGRGAIVRVLRAAGHAVLSTDLIDYNSPDQDLAGVNFVRPLENLPEVDAIVMNPPFSLARECIEHAMDYAPMVYVLLRLAFLESEIRYPFFRSGKLARIHCFSDRLPMMHRDSYKGKKATSTIPFAWYVFDREYAGTTQLDWIMWKPQK